MTDIPNLTPTQKALLRNVIAIFAEFNEKLPPLSAALDASIEGISQLVNTNTIDDSLTARIQAGMAAAQGIDTGNLALAGSILETVLGDLEKKMEEGQ